MEAELRRKKDMLRTFRSLRRFKFRSEENEEQMAIHLWLLCWLCLQVSCVSPGAQLPELGAEGGAEVPEEHRARWADAFSAQASMIRARLGQNSGFSGCSSVLHYHSIVGETSIS